MSAEQRGRELELTLPAAVRPGRSTVAPYPEASVTW